MSWRYQEERCYFSNISNISIVSVLHVPSFIFTGCCLVAGCCVSIASLFAVIVEFLHALCNCWICVLLPWMMAGGFVLQPHSWLGVLDHNLSPWPCKTRCHMFGVVAPVSECAQSSRAWTVNVSAWRPDGAARRSPPRWPVSCRGAHLTASIFIKHTGAVRLVRRPADRHWDLWNPWPLNLWPSQDSNCPYCPEMCLKTASC